MTVGTGFLVMNDVIPPRSLGAESGLFWGFNFGWLLDMRFFCGQQGLDLF
jgi:hypothetical protein